MRKSSVFPWSQRSNRNPVARFCPAIAGLVSMGIGIAAVGVKADDGWKVLATSKNSKISAKYETTSQIRHIRAESHMDASVESVWKVLCDVRNWTHFMPYVEKAEVLSEREGECSLYQVLSPPFVKKRDFALKVQMERDPERKMFRREWKVANELAPALKPGMVRLQVNNGSWTVSETAPGKTLAKLEFTTDPGGEVPENLARIGDLQGVKKLLVAVEKRAAQEDR